MSNALSLEEVMKRCYKLKDAEVSFEATVTIPVEVSIYAAQEDNSFTIECVVRFPGTNDYATLISCKTDKPEDDPESMAKTFSIAPTKKVWHIGIDHSFEE